MKTLLTAFCTILLSINCHALTITTKHIQGNPFCGGETINVIFVLDQAANAGNVFTAQLSDKNGNFGAPVNIGTLTSTGAGTIAATIPLGTPTGPDYRIRVISSNPVVIGSSCPNKLRINPPPTGVSVSGITSCSVTLNWIAAPTAVSYKVRYKPAGGSYTLSLDVGNVTSYTFGSLSASTQYSLEVRAVCPTNDKSSWSNVIVTTVSCPIPTGLIVTDIGLTTTSLNWNDAPCATDYSFRYKMFGGTNWTYLHPVPSNIDLTGLFPATLYEAQVATRCTPTDSGAFTASTIWETEYFRLSGDADLAATFSVFPNPSNGEITIQFYASNETGSADISVQNIYGQIVYKVSKKPISGLNEEKITLQNAAHGMYLVTVKANDKEFKQSVLVR